MDFRLFFLSVFIFVGLLSVIAQKENINIKYLTTADDLSSNTVLDPGNYIFKVKASGHDGTWNEERTSVKLIITPSFWRIWWIRIILTFIFLGTAVTIYFVRVKAIEAQRVVLENQVNERTAEVGLQKGQLEAQAEFLQSLNSELKTSQEEIAVQKDRLKIVNEQLMSSIEYARIIQKAILRSQQKISLIFPSHIILYRPKGVVSGDFYWFVHLQKEESGLGKDFSFVAVVDCTGHGVPGAFMSILGNNILNEVVKLKNITDPAHILELLNEGVIAAVDKTTGLNTTGMDVCLCRIEAWNESQLKILYSGAKRNLMYNRFGRREVEKLNADRRSIGSISTTPFTSQELILEKGSMLYLFSDGFADQNNDNREKMGSFKLKKMMEEVISLSPDEQLKALERKLEAHQQSSEQRDDITIVGLKL